MNEIIDYPMFVIEPRLISMSTANIIGVLFFAFFINLYGVPFYLLWDLDEAITVMKNNIHDNDSNVR